ncbi:hypothetical protein V2J09_006592 [Rumex salicifolius]
MLTTQKSQAAEQQQALVSSSGNMSFSGSTVASFGGEDDISKSALSNFRAKEEEIERKKMEVRERVQAQLGRIEEETKRLAIIREELEALADPMRKEVAHVRKRVDTVNKDLKLLGLTVQKKEKEYKDALDAYNDKNKEKVQLINKLVELVGESERSRMKKLEELSKSGNTCPCRQGNRLTATQVRPWSIRLSVLMLTTQKPQAAEQQQALVSSSGNLSFNGSMASSGGEDDMSKSALSNFRAKEEEIERKKMEVREKVQAQLGRVEEETKRLAIIREELEALADPMRKEVAHVRKRVDSVNKDLKLLGLTVQKKEKEYKDALDSYNDKNKEKAQLINKLVELVGESERSRMKKLEELSKSVETLH